MTNRYRGEVALDLEGRSHTLCLTLDALARLETAFGAASLGDLIGRLGAPSSAQMAIVLTEALVAGARTDRQEAERLIGGAPAAGLARAYVCLLRATFLDET